MPAPLIATVMSAIAPALAKRGFDLLSGVPSGRIDFRHESGELRFKEGITSGFSKKPKRYLGIRPGAN